MMNAPFSPPDITELEIEAVDKTFTFEEVLPGKMKYNLQAVETLGFFGDVKLIFVMVFAVLGKDYQVID